MSEKTLTNSLTDTTEYTAPVLFYHDTYYAPVGIHQALLYKGHVWEKDQKLFRDYFKKYKCYIAAFAKEKTYTISDFDQFYERARLIKILFKNLTFDDEMLFNMELTQTELNKTYFTRIEAEVKIMAYNKEKQLVKFVLAPPASKDKQKEMGLRTRLLDNLDKVFTKANSKEGLAEFYGIESDIELANAIFTYLILSEHLAGPENARRIHEYYLTDTITDRFNYLIDELEKLNYTGIIRHFPLQLSTALKTSDIGALGKEQIYKKQINEIKNIDPGIKQELLRKVDYLEKLSEGSTKADLLAYLDTVTNVPWNKHTKPGTDLKEVRQKLDVNVYGMKDAKDKILQYIAVDIHKTGNQKGSVLCLVGPPGVGKTLFAQSLAEALNRELTSIALGGMDDVTILRGQRKGWIGAEPGQLVKALIRTKCMNPIIVFDEIDKISGFRGTQIQAALLEILDPNQNDEFKDAFLDIPIDLSNILFITTANDVSELPAALKDRLDIIELHGYTPYEKEQIFVEYVLPKTLKNLEINEDGVVFDSETIQEIIYNNKNEVGIRGIEKNIQEISRKYLVENLESGKKQLNVTVKNLRDYIELKPKDIFKPEGKKIGEVNILWVGTTGNFGGYGGRGTIQVQLIHGKGNSAITGSVQDVFKESITVALGYIKANYRKYNIDPAFFDSHDFLLHAPETSIKKDGPSAGLAITIGIYSALKLAETPQNIAMTGEIDLSGNVLPVGGIKSKLAGGYQAGIKEFILPASNEENFIRIEDEKMKKGIKVHFVENIEDALVIIFNDKVK